MTSPEQLERLEELSLLRDAARALDAGLDMSQVLEAAARVPAVALQARTAILRLVDDEGNLAVVSRLDATGASAETLPAEERLARRVRITQAPRVVADLREEPEAGGPDQPPGWPALVVPLGTSGVIGTLSVCGTRSGGPFPVRDVRILTALAEQIGRRLEQARRFGEAEQRAGQLAALREIGQAIVARLDLPAVLEAVVTGTKRLLNTDHVQIILWDEESRRLCFGAAAGPEAERVRRQVFAMGLGVNGMVAATRDPMVLNDYRASPYALAEFPDVVATITTPVMFGDRLLGVLHSHTTRRGRRFTSDDLRLMQMLATQAAIAIENARLFREAEQLAEANLLKLRQISILNEIGNAMQGTMHLDDVLQVILTGVTFGGGLGFNRAVLLLVDEERGLLRGRMGVGPSTGEDAARIWHELTAQPRPLREIIAERAARHWSEREASRFDRLARHLELPLDHDDCVLVRTVREARPFRVPAVGASRVPQQWEAHLDMGEYASVPLLSKGKVVGVVVVDNKFSGKPITDADLELLSVFAGQAGLAVENARVYTRLEEAHREIQTSHHQLVRQERLAALGEMAAHVVHEIRNPLVAIGGFARRLAQRLAGREPEAVYAQVIAREVDRLERIVHDVRGMSRELQVHLAETDLHALLQECLVLVAERVALQHVVLRMDLADRAPVLTLDALRVKQAILNLLANALDAMPSGGTLTLATHVSPGQDLDAAGGPAPAEPGSPAPRRQEAASYRLSPGEWAVVSVTDTGGGIPAGILEDIYKPFFTTKEVGTGLGLALIRRIVRSHGGRVDMDNRPGDGVTFRIWLPAKVAGGPA